MTDNEASKILALAGGATCVARRRKPSRGEALAYATLYYAGHNGAILRQLTAAERTKNRHDYELERRQNWERKMFGRVKTDEWSPVISLNPKHLTT